VTPSTILIADSGSSKADWCLLTGHQKKTFTTTGINPYFLNEDEMLALLQKELTPKIKKQMPDKIFFYGAGCGTMEKMSQVKNVLKKVTGTKKIKVDTDLTAAAMSLSGNEKGIICILGTGSNACYYNGKKIVRRSPSLGYILGDEGSGSYLGRKVLQYHLHGIFEHELQEKFLQQFPVTTSAVLDSIYRGEQPNRYLAQFARFLSDNRGHFMIENIIEDGLNDFFFQHLNRIPEAWKYPIHFTGSISYAFRDVIHVLCTSYGFTPGKITAKPMPGLIRYHVGLAYK
jgi:N-acetylglucosamine kinase-like BadF-type ATPase